MKISINCHSSIRIEGDKVIYFDPFKINEEVHDADIIFVTHDHFDHFSIDDIKKIEKEDTIYVIPECMYNLLGGENVITVNPLEEFMVENYKCKAVRSYNVGKDFHKKEFGYLGYIVNIEGKDVYVFGDGNVNEDVLKVKCDIALVPVGGLYTMDYKEAAEYINTIKPLKAIPTHYGDLTGDKEDGLRFKELVDKDIEVEILIY
ncbi:MAG: MBL fold metallo-hydrolase [Erysipelotrichaceae bacterium]|nr:MBL fold metallo-hydrolase [Erysipelotrichaceae bacterium]